MKTRGFASCFYLVNLLLSKIWFYMVNIDCSRFQITDSRFQIPDSKLRPGSQVAKAEVCKTFIVGSIPTQAS